MQWGQNKQLFKQMFSSKMFSLRPISGGCALWFGYVTHRAHCLRNTLSWRISRLAAPKTSHNTTINRLSIHGYYSIRGIILRMESANKGYSHKLVFIFLSDWCFMPYGSIFHLFNGGQHYGETKQDITWQESHDHHWLVPQLWVQIDKEENLNERYGIQWQYIFLYFPLFFWLIFCEFYSSLSVYSTFLSYSYKFWILQIQYASPQE